MTLAKWMDDLDTLCHSEMQMNIHDLPEELFRNAYESGVTPKQFYARYGCSHLSGPLSRSDEVMRILGLLSKDEESLESLMPRSRRLSPRR